MNEHLTPIDYDKMAYELKFIGPKIGKLESRVRGIKRTKKDTEAKLKRAENDVLMRLFDDEDSRYHVVRADERKVLVAKAQDADAEVIKLRKQLESRVAGLDEKEAELAGLEHTRKSYYAILVAFHAKVMSEEKLEKEFRDMPRHKAAA